MKRVYLDIETIPGPHRPSPDSIKAPANYKDPDKIRAYQLESVDAVWRKEALNPLKGEIICVCVEVHEGVIAPFSRNVYTNEKKLLWGLQDYLQHMVKDDIITWCGHNIAEFDLQWLRLRALKYNLTWLLNRIDLNRYHGNYEDTLQATGSWNDKYSLHDLCAYFGIEDNQDVDGSMVFDLWSDGEIDKIVSHCRQDVEQARKLHKIIFQA